MESNDDEINALKAIFMDDFSILEMESPWKTPWEVKKTPFQIKLKPSISDDNIFIYLIVQFPKKYPMQLPELTLKKGNGVNDADIKILNDMLVKRSTELIGQEMIYELTTLVTDYLQNIVNNEFHSLFDAKVEQDERLKQFLSTKELIEKTNDESEQKFREIRLNTKIKEEILKKKEIIKRNRIKIKQNLEDKFIKLNHSEDISTYLAEVNSTLYLVNQIKLIASDDVKKEVSGFESFLNQQLEFNHRNLLILKSFDIEEDNNSSLLTITLYFDFYNYLSLEQILSDVKNSSFSFLAIKKIMISILEGLKFLHDKNISHDSLSCKTVLFCQDSTIKLAFMHDKKLLSLKKKIHYNSETDWVPPESSFEYLPKFGKSVDIFHVGTIFINLILGINIPSSIYQVFESVDFKNLQLQVQSLIYKLTVTLFLLIKSDDPENRPTVDQVLNSQIFLSLSTETESSDSKAKYNYYTDSDNIFERKPRYTSHLSRYQNEFNELEFLGRGAFGSVVKVQNRLDGQYYAIKKIRLEPKDNERNKNILREVMTLSRIYHVHVVRYYQTWMEALQGNEVFFSEDEDHLDCINSNKSRTISFTSARDISSSDETESEYEARIDKILFIQMEYCEKKTLQNTIEEGLEVSESWRLFRQILEGLVHIHQLKIIHRDLKPSNIFMDSEANVKIGDFGLATWKDISFSNSEGEVGTSFYLAPEGNSNPTEKVDIYALGIILMEMTFPFTTGMERVIVLKNIRKMEVEFPSNYPLKLVSQKKIISWLLSHDPNQRPSALEILASDYLPAKNSTKTVHPSSENLIQNNNYYTKLIGSLFSQRPDKLKDFTYDFNVPNFNSTNSMVFNKLLQLIIGIFKNHCAVECSCPLLMPKSFFEKEKTCNLLDSEGTVVELPFDLTLPFARWISRNNIINIKRWSYGKVFRRSIAGGQPRFVDEIDFDIVHQSAELIHNVEVVKVCADIFGEFSNFQNYYICVNHGKIIEAMFKFSGIDLDESPKFHCSQSWKQARVTLNNKYNSRNLDLLESLVLLEGKIEVVFEEMKNIGLIGKYSEATLAMKELSDFSIILKEMGMNCRVCFQGSLCFNYNYYKTGFIFQVLLDVKERVILCSGGRYGNMMVLRIDSLLLHFQGQNSRRKHAVGVQIAIGKLEHLILNSNSKSTKLWMPRRCDVYVVSFGGEKALQTDRMKICNELWMAEIKAEYQIMECSLDEVVNYCKEQGITWIVMLKKDGNVKIKNLRGQKQEAEIKRSEIVEYMLIQINTQQKIDTEKAGFEKKENKKYKRRM